ncbi:hypothetical protein QYF61_022592 [Mycteria americana]|uniref:Uncharacterized protein n=1 Tax=Mycteria americana TaxID=33587 RepID=A0AAN7MH88_MYCAM|nr:hypothetical protein QYF61_022592 [Mycteria americana]
MLHVKEVFRTQASGPFPAPRHACVPVDFEEVRVSAEAPEDDVHNAIMAIRRNGVALKGECRASDPPRQLGDTLTLISIPSPGNIETNHNLPPSHKSRNNLIR